MKKFLVLHTTSPRWTRANSCPHKGRFIAIRGPGTEGQHSFSAKEKMELPYD